MNTYCHSPGPREIFCPFVGVSGAGVACIAFDDLLYYIHNRVLPIISLVEKTY